MTGTVPKGARVLITRDIPRSCICMWDWDGAKWVIVRLLPGCPWHDGGRRPA